MLIPMEYLFNRSILRAKEKKHGRSFAGENVRMFFLWHFMFRVVLVHFGETSVLCYTLAFEHVN